MENKYVKKILYNIFWMIFGRIVVILVGMIVTLTIINHYQILENGIYQYSLSIISVLEMVTFFVDAKVIKKQYSKYNSEMIIFNVMIIRVLITAIISFFVSTFIIFFQNEKVFKYIFILMLVNLNLQQLSFGITNYLEYNLNSKIITVFSSFCSLIGYFLQILIIKLNLSIVYLCLVNCFDSCIYFIFLYCFYKKHYSDNEKKYFKYNYNFIKLVLIESFPIAVAAICSGIYSHCDILMIGKLMSFNEVAIYSLSVKLVNMVQMPINAIRESIYPYFIEKFNKSKLDCYNFYLKITSMLTWFVILCLILSVFILPLVFKFINEDYKSSLSVYFLLSLSSIFVYNAVLRSSYITIISKGKILMFSQFFSVIINILLNYYFIRIYGIYGAAFATVITQFLSLFVSNLLFGEEGERIFRIQLMSFNPLCALGKVKY